MSNTIKVFSGNANPQLSQEIITHLNLPQGQAFVGTFSDGETQVDIRENVRGCDVFIIQPTCPTRILVISLSQLFNPTLLPHFYICFWPLKDPYQW